MVAGDSASPRVPWEMTSLEQRNYLGLLADRGLPPEMLKRPQML